MGSSTKLKLTIAALVIMVFAAIVFYILQLMDTTLWIAWIGAITTLVTQYSVANAVITTKALNGNGGSHVPPLVG